MRPSASATRAERHSLGVIWLALTIAFECGFGRLVAKKSGRELLADYDLRQGRLWPLVLVWIAAGPVTIRELDAARAERIAPWG